MGRVRGIDNVCVREREYVYREGNGKQGRRGESRMSERG